MLRLVAAAAGLSLATAAGLVDHPIVGDALTYLDGADWKVAATEPGHLDDASAPALWTMPGKVPGDLLSDLEAADLIGDPLCDSAPSRLRPRPQVPRLSRASPPVLASPFALICFIAPGLGTS